MNRPARRPAPPALNRLLVKTRQLDPESRRQLWRAYRDLRRGVRTRELLDSVDRVAQRLAERRTRGAEYRALSLALKLTQAYTLAQMRQAGASTRVQRALFIEAFHLTRLAFRAALGLRDPEHVPVVQFGIPLDVPGWHAYCDGSLRLTNAGLGVALFLPDLTLHSEISLPMTADTALECELAAARVCLATLLALGARVARVHIDSLGVFRAFEGRLAVKYGAEQEGLLQLCQQFRALEVALVPRLHNHIADRLAAGKRILK